MSLPELHSLGEPGEGSVPLPSGGPSGRRTRSLFSRLPVGRGRKSPFFPRILGSRWSRRDLTTFLGPCGAKPWGSGGAPPTDLILLRNQRRSRPAPERRRDRPTRGPRRAGPPTWSGCGLLQAGRWGWGVGWSPEWVVTRGMRKASCLILAPRAGPLTSVCDMSPTAAVVDTPFAPWSGVRRRSYRVPSFDHIHAMPYRYRSSVGMVLTFCQPSSQCWMMFGVGGNTATSHHLSPISAPNGARSLVNVNPQR